MKMKYFGLTETKIFHFIGYLKMGRRGGGSRETPEPPLDPPQPKLNFFATQSAVGLVFADCACININYPVF